MLTDLLNILFWSVVLVVSSVLLERMWAYSLARWLYIIFASPGIIVHELSHLVACLITGAKVTKVVLISREGGSVTHGRPRWGLLGQTIVSMAPFAGIPLVLVLAGLVFDLVPFFRLDMTWGHRQSWDFGNMLMGTFVSALELIRDNLFDNGSLWFLLYLYLAASLTVSLAPSKQDLKNSWMGLALVLAALMVWALLYDNFLSGLGWKAPLTYFLMDSLGWTVALGLVMSLLGSVLGLPLFLLKTFLDKKGLS
jgi:hypothetical protein